MDTITYWRRRAKPPWVPLLMQAGRQDQAARHAEQKAVQHRVKAQELRDRAAAAKLARDTPA